MTYITYRIYIMKNGTPINDPRFCDPKFVDKEDYWYRHDDTLSVSDENYVKLQGVLENMYNLTLLQSYMIRQVERDCIKATEKVLREDVKGE